MNALRRSPDRHSRAASGRTALASDALGVRTAGWFMTSAASLAATVVLAAVTGLPAKSVPNLLPHSGEQGGPQIGV